jgi:rhamnosyl/mannosyltransferase
MTWLWNQPEAASSMGESAQRRFEAVFLSDSMAKSYADIYRSLL